jgi:hypothetical protein
MPNRYFNTDFWRDPYVEKLESTERYLFIYCFTNPSANIAGIYEVGINRISYETGLKNDEILKIFEKFEADGKILYKNDFIVCRNTIKHQKLNPNIKTGIEKIINESPIELVTWLCGNALIKDGESLYIAFESLSKPSNYINLNININTNINTDETSVSQPQKKQVSEKPKKVITKTTTKTKKYLDYDDIKQYRDNIWIREKDYNSLIDKYGRKQTEKMIEKLCGYKLANDKTYASDYGAIIQWVRESCSVQPIGSDGPKNLNYEDIQDIEF